MAEGKYDVACPKFRESFRLDPHVGSAINLADCEVAAGHLAMARIHFQEAIEVAHSLGDQRESFAADRLAQIDARVPRLTLRAGSSFPTDGIVTKDGVVVGSINLGVPLPVEVGAHIVTVSSHGFSPKTLTVELAEREAKEVVLEVGDALPPELSVLEPPKDAPPPRKMTTMKKVALSTAGVGVAALAVGSGFGIAAIAAKGNPQGNCPPGGTCDSAAQSRNFALAEGDAATVLFIAGGALVGTAAVLWFVPARRSTQSGWTLTPSVGARSMSLAGTF